MKNGRVIAGSERAVLVVLAAGAVVIATLFTRGADPFRLSKELVFHGEAIALLVMAAFWITAKRRTWTVGKRPEFILAAAILGWTIVTTAASTNRLLSIDSLITVVAAVVIFVATCLAAQTKTLVMVDVLMTGCCVNAVVVILQELKIMLQMGRTDATVADLATAARFDPNVLEQLDSGLHARVAAVSGVR